MKNTTWVIALAATGLLAGQSQLAPKSPETATNSEHKSLAAGEPLLGFASEPGGTKLYAVLGTANRPKFSSLLETPRGVRKLYLPPRQRYALVEINGQGSPEIWTLKNASAPCGQHDLISVPGLISHPDLVAFSPVADTAVLASVSEGRIQVVSGLPAQPSIVRELSTGGRIPSSLAVTDDAVLLVAQFGDDAMPFFSIMGSSWLPVSTSVRPRAWIFLPRTHDLAVSDAAQNEIALLPNVSGSPIAQRVLASGKSAEEIAVTSDADEILAASPTTGIVWEIPLVAGGRSRQLRYPALGALSTLRDGHAFLLSSFPQLTLLRATASELHAGH